MSSRNDTVFDVRIGLAQVVAQQGLLRQVIDRENRERDERLAALIRRALR